MELSLFDEMPQRDAFSWPTAISKLVVWTVLVSCLIKCLPGVWHHQDRALGGL
jgi:hypothetical protein